MRLRYAFFAGLCAASFGCADIACPEGRVPDARQVACLCASGTVSRGAECVRADDPSVAREPRAGSTMRDADVDVDASPSAASRETCAGDGGCADAAAGSDAASPRDAGA